MSPGLHPEPFGFGMKPRFTPVAASAAATAPHRPPRPYIGQCSTPVEHHPSGDR